MENLRTLKRPKKNPKNVSDNYILYVNIFLCFKPCKFILSLDKVIIKNV